MKRSFSFKKIKKRIKKEADRKKLLTALAVNLVLAMLIALVGVGLAYGGVRALPFLLSTLVLFLLVSVFRGLKWSTRFAEGGIRSLFDVAIVGLLCVSTLSLAIYALIVSHFKLGDMNWRVIFSRCLIDGRFYATFFIVYALFFVLYYGFISREELRGVIFFRGIRGKGEIAQIEANLENSRWMTDAERDKIFTSLSYSELKDTKKDGVPIRALFDGTEMHATAESDGRLRMGYTGGTGAHRADRMVCDYLRMRKILGLNHAVTVVTDDKDFAKEAAALGAAVKGTDTLNAQTPA